MTRDGTLKSATQQAMLKEPDARPKIYLITVSLTGYQFFKRYLWPLKLVTSKLFSNEGFFIYHQFFPGVY